MVDRAYAVRVGLRRSCGQTYRQSRIELQGVGVTLRIGIDASCWWNRRGFGRFTRHLLTSMFAEGRGHEFVLFADQPATPEMICPNVRVVSVPVRKTVTASAIAEGSRSIGDILAFRSSVASEPLDVMYFPAVYSWYPTGSRTPVAITFHDAIAEHFPDLVFPKLRQRMLWNTKVWLAKRNADCITTVSNAAREEIARYLHIDPRRIHVTLEAADPRFRPERDPAIRAAMRARLGLDPKARLLTYVGGMAPHKNLARLVVAFAQALESDALGDVTLVLVGDPAGDGFHSNHADLQKRVESDPRLEGRVRFTGFIEDDDLITLYSDAWLVALPSVAEGFGLPAAEAIACGTPVIAARGGAVAEVVAMAGAFFDPLNVDDIARVIVKLASDPSLMATLRARCAERALQLSWEKTASEMLDVLEGCAARR
jgi:glycosyltransferase involved in cell wall biosynthesis